ncbi:hypothetical protein [Propionivibrio sp.]|uniref:hypothetical protein n=1 Tax=Propionivibrio sp. TaxID=2212460 RepID=UPI003BF31BF1
MNFFTKLPGYTKTPPGLEREVLRRLPKTLLFGMLLLGVPSLIARFLLWYGIESVSETQITTVEYYAISLVILHWTIIGTVAIGAFIVLVMKGPAYVADAYPLEDSDTPKGNKQADSPSRPLAE